MRGPVTVVLLCAVLLCGCTAASKPPVRTIERIITHTNTPTPTFVPKPARTVRPLPPDAHPPVGEVEKRCPYIASTPEQDAKVNVQDIEGDHVYRTTVLTGPKPVGCRFYFYAPPFEAIADIVPRTFDTPLDAHNAMVITARAGAEAQGKPDILPGVDAILYRTRFFGPDGSRDWACVFVKGKLMAIVHTQRKDQSLSALLLAKAIARKL